jgi:hypothetical protein
MALKPSPFLKERAMVFEEILPHLNKLAALYLTNNRRRVGWLYTDSSNKVKKDQEIYLITMKDRQLIERPRAKDLEDLEKVREKIPLNEIVRIRSIE